MKETLGSTVKESVDEAVAEITISRESLEQAKGMLVYGITADRAFDVLTWRSQETHVKVSRRSRTTEKGLSLWS